MVAWCWTGDKPLSEPIMSQLTVAYFDSLVQERHTSCALVMELRLSCTNPSIYAYIQKWVGLVKLLCIIMFKISKIRSKSLLSLVKAQNFWRCLTMPVVVCEYLRIAWSCYIQVCTSIYVISICRGGQTPAWYVCILPGSHHVFTQDLLGITNWSLIENLGW